MNGNGASVKAVIDATHKWIQQPFRAQGNLLNWFLIVGVVIVSAILWSRILAHIGE
jgi:hypothetical protein